MNNVNPNTLSWDPNTLWSPENAAKFLLMKLETLPRLPESLKQDPDANRDYVDFFVRLEAEADEVLAVLSKFYPTLASAPAIMQAQFERMLRGA